FLEKGIDTLSIARHIEQAKKDMDISLEGVLQNPGPIHTLRDLKVTSVILTGLVQRMEHERQLLESSLNQLTTYRERIDSLTGNATLMDFPDDSVTLVKYLAKLLIAAKDLDPTDSTLRQSIFNVQELQTKIDLAEYELNANLDQVEQRRETLSGLTMARELPLTAPEKSFREGWALSWRKDVLALQHYLEHQLLLIFFLFMCVLTSWRFLWVLKSKLNQDQPLNTEQALVVRYPVISAIIIVFSLFQFLFPDPPFLVNLFFWGLPALLLTFVFSGYISVLWLRFWITTLVLFLLASADNLLLQASTMERWLMGGLSLAGILHGGWHLSPARRSSLREKRILYFILFLVLIEAAALAFNFAGRYNLAKILMTSGYFGLVIAILFLWTLRLINGGLAIASNIYQQPDRHLFFINFNRVGANVPSIFYLALVAGWLVLVGRNFYIYAKLAAPFVSFITDQRTIGSYSFSIKGMLIFITILACALFLSRLISFFAGEDHSQQPPQGKSKLSLGSWLLLVRIGVISTGLFLAVAAAGIPLDRITIIVGALGVGIGLGLQGLVSNLVSGLILAFEKPVNVGDLIEVNGNLGTMKSIGFRSSTIALVNGSVNIIPNSDILNHQLVNWSMGKKQVRANLTVGVAYNSNLEQVQAILHKAIEAQDNVLKTPAPLVVVKAFSDSSIDFDLFFWVRMMAEVYPTKSAVLLAINAAFNEAGIIIPFPQTDIHLTQDNNRKTDAARGDEQAG
ncbi:mechanosensitive ion channel domain-containing protein, partial [uncultured Chitinophaga sp.]|uniref:mechanosensitive ion channel family protein n=1 Tax=uncultured Chitinophaga sp. TaxID=339340 RepID=UPI0025DFA313